MSPGLAREDCCYGFFFSFREKPGSKISRRKLCVTQSLARERSILRPGHANHIGITILHSLIRSANADIFDPRSGPEDAGFTSMSWACVTHFWSRNPRAMFVKVEQKSYFSNWGRDSATPPHYDKSNMDHQRLAGFSYYCLNDPFRLPTDKPAHPLLWTHSSRRPQTDQRQLHIQHVQAAYR